MEMPLWFSNLASWSIQVALLVMAAAFLARALRLQQPRVLLVSWRALLAICLLLPVVQPWHRPQAVGPAAVSSDFGGVPLPPPSSPAVSHWHFPTLQSTAPLLGLIILLGIALRFATLLLGLLKLRRLRQASFPIASSAESAAVLQAMRTLLDAPAEFRLSSQVDSPVTFGFIAPVVLLPERFSSLELRFQSAIACHELLHVCRRDWAHHLSEEVLRAVFWFHPAIAWLVSRVRLAREQVVDSEVVRLTNARKSYLESLLEFASGRAPIAAIPAPPFLAERQLVERVSLMVKEVPMSRKRLIGSLTVSSGCLALVIAVAAWAFPLKGAPLAAQSAPKGGVTGGPSGGPSGGVTGGVSEGVVGGVEGGIRGDAEKRASTDEPSVDMSTIWVDTVKRGTFYEQVRGLGTLVRAEDSPGVVSTANLVAKVMVPRPMALEVGPGQHVIFNTRKGAVKGPLEGRVIGLKAATPDELAVYIGLDSPLPEGASEGLAVDGTIDIQKIDNALYIGRPANVPANSGANVSAALYKIDADGKGAERVIVKIGRPSVNTVEVLAGLKEGDKVILSDMSSVESAERVHLTDKQHLVHN